MTAALAVAAAPLPAATVYLALGDSITESWFNWDARCPGPECGYPGRLEQRVRAAGFDAEVRNYGLGGEKTWQALERVEGVLDANPDGDVLLLMEGSNDVSQEIGPETTAFNLEAIAEKAADDGLGTVHATTIPRWPAAPVDSGNVVNQELAWRIRALAWNHERPLVDPFAVFSPIPNLFDDYYSHFNPADVVGHPNTQGFDLLADTFFDVLVGNDEVPPVLGFVDPLDGAGQVSPMAEIRVRLFDFASGIDVANTELVVSGTPVRFTTSGDTRRLDLTHVPTTPLAGTVTVGVVTQDLASPANGWSRQVASFTVGAGGLAELEQNEIEADKESADAVRARLVARAPNRSHPLVTILTPARSGGVEVSSHTTQHDRNGATKQAAESRIVYTVGKGSFETREQPTPVATVALARVDPASDLVAGATDAGLIEIELLNGFGDRLELDNRLGGGAADSGIAGDLADAVASDHEQRFGGRDWLELDMLHEILTLQLCDNVSGPVTTCYDAWAAVSRRGAPDKIQVRFGCQGTPCGTGYLNLHFRYDGSGRAHRVDADLLLDDPRFDLQPEAAIYLKTPRPPGGLWSDAPAVMVDGQNTVGSRKVDLIQLHADADATRLDPKAE